MTHILKHASSLHPFVQRAISMVKVGRPKPLWYDTIVLEYPPMETFRMEIVGSIVTKSNDEKRKERKKMRSMMTKKDKERSHYGSLFKTEFEKRSNLVSIVYPEDIVRKDIFEKLPLENLRNPFSLSSSLYYSDLNIESIVEKQMEYLCDESISYDQAQKKAIEDHSVLLGQRAVEEKMAREQALLLGHCVDPIDPSIRMYAEQEEKIISSNHMSSNLLISKTC